MQYRHIDTTKYFEVSCQLKIIDFIEILICLQYLKPKNVHLNHQIDYLEMKILWSHLVSEELDPQNLNTTLFHHH